MERELKSQNRQKYRSRRRNGLTTVKREARTRTTVMVGTKKLVVASEALMTLTVKRLSKPTKQDSPSIPKTNAK